MASRSAGPNQARAPEVQHQVFRCLFSLPLFSDSPHFCLSILGAPSPLGFLSRLLHFSAAAAAPVSSVSRPSSHDFSFCLSDSFKQKHTSKAPQRGSSLNFSDFWFSCPFSPPPLFLPFSSVMLVFKSLEWHGDRSDGFVLCSGPHSPGSCLYHCLSPTSLLLGLLGPTAWGGFKSIIRNLLETEPSAPLSPKQIPGGQLMFPTIRHLLPSLPHSFPADPLLFLVSVLKSTRCLMGICFPC